jgi:protoporphyrinogen oxidase
MSGYNKFDAEIYSEELFSVTEAEHDAVMAEMWGGYEEWSEELESQLEAEAWRGAKNVAGVLIKKACEHPACSHFKCERGLRMGGIAI